MENFMIKTNNNIYNNNLEKLGILHSGNVQKNSPRNKASKALVDCQYDHNFSYKSVFKLTKSNRNRLINFCK